MRPVAHVTFPTDPPYGAGCTWADHETRSTGSIDPHWHCAAFESGGCLKLHVTEQDAVDCPVKDQPTLLYQLMKSLSSIAGHCHPAPPASEPALHAETLRLLGEVVVKLHRRLKAAESELESLRRQAFDRQRGPR